MLETTTEKTLFELRRNADDELEVYESEEWRAYHASRRASHTGKQADCGPLAWLWERRRTRHADLKRRFNALQRIYDDVYGDLRSDINSAQAVEADA
ncbi:MAG: hypothetical protein GYB65_00340 [Chloroflexi bacterium]|nr:hypothetical protein [Chloroflexota bacterium]